MDTKYQTLSGFFLIYPFFFFVYFLFGFLFSLLSLCESQLFHLCLHAVVLSILFTKSSNSLRILFLPSWFSLLSLNLTISYLISNRIPIDLRFVWVAEVLVPIITFLAVILIKERCYFAMSLFDIFGVFSHIHFLSGGSKFLCFSSLY